jgi:hypothetical protein
MNNNIYNRRYLYDVINSNDDNLSLRDKQEMDKLRSITPDLGLLTMHVSFCSDPLAYKECIACNLAINNTQ